jgi:hypothetical protein
LELAGYVVTDEFLSADDCRRLLGQIDDYRSTTDLPEIHRATRGRDLRYLVIDGHQIREQLPDIWDLYTGSVQARMSEVAGEEMFPLQNERAGVNVNVMEPGNSEYRWHYDRTPVTAVLYLNAVEGGAAELYRACGYCSAISGALAPSASWTAWLPPDWCAGRDPRRWP